MLQEEVLHRINNQLAVVMGRAELLGCQVGDTRSRDNCAEIELAVQRITTLLNDAADQS
jgi:two-component sensor histidine kinase